MWCGGLRQRCWPYRECPVCVLLLLCRVGCIEKLLPLMLVCMGTGMWMRRRALCNMFQ